MTPSEEIVIGVCEAVRGLVTLPPGERVEPATRLLDGGLGLDSVVVIELLLALEQRFGCHIPEDAMTAENLATVAAVAALVAREQGRPKGADA